MNFDLQVLIESLVPQIIAGFRFIASFGYLVNLNKSLRVNMPTLVASSPSVATLERFFIFEDHHDLAFSHFYM